MTCRPLLATCVCSLLATLLSLCTVQAASPPALIPQPVQVAVEAGTFRIDARTPVVAVGHDASTRRTADYLVDLLARARGLHLRVESEPAAGPAIVLRLDPKTSVNVVEGYALYVTPQGIRISARDAAGLFYGVITAYQLLTPDATQGPVEVPMLRIRDAPRFSWRGLMLDSARHFQTTAEVRTLIDQMALHKLNVLHWHLTDDQGWRIQIRRYPAFTAIGAWRLPPDAGRDGEPRRYGGFYTQEEIRALVRYAADRYITIVPEIDLPGHATAAVASYPQLGVTGKRPPVSIDWGVHTTLYSPDPATIHFMEQVLDEVMALFPSRYIHLGGDEAVKDQWQASPAVQAQIKRLGLNNEDALQSWMMGQLGAYLQQHGRRMLGWDEILQGGAPADATVMSWNGVQGAVAAARKGHDVVLSPSPDLYFDQLQSARDDEGTGRVPVESLAAIYAFEPVPKALGADEARHVLGAQANVWTEHMPDMRHVEHAVFPRLDALAEAVWTPPAQRSWPDFLARLPAQLRRYSQAGIAWADSAFAPDVRFDRAQALASGKATITLSNQAQFGTLRYTLDGSVPTMRSPAYAQPFDVRLPATVRAATYAADGTALAAARSRRIDIASLLSRNGNQLANCPGSTFRLRTQPLPDATTWMPVYEVPLFDGCQIYAAAPLDGVTGLRVELARLPRNYALAHEQKRVVSHAATTPHGELLVRRDDCNGALLATLPLPDPASTPRRFALKHALPGGQGTHDLCLVFTAPIDGPIYVFDRVSLQREEDSP